MNLDHFSYHFYPVGQGLFTAGFLSRNGEPEFAWVYDCGTSSGQNLAEDAIGILGECVGRRERVDLMVLSHFDKDHISGVCELLKRIKVRRLMLPYMTLTERLVLAFEEGIGVTDPVIGFFVNPVAYLLSQDGGQAVGQVVFVPASGGAGPEPQEDTEPPPAPDDNDVEMKTDAELANSNEGRALSDAGHPGAIPPPVVFLQPGTAIKLPARFWEFVPYNDDFRKKVSDNFVNQVEAKRNRLLRSSDDADRAACLKELRKAYDDEFGRGSKNRNIISLFVYAGPLLGQKRWRLMDARSWELKPQRGSSHGSYWPRTVWTAYGVLDAEGGERCAVLYSGDGFLDTTRRLQKLTKYLGSQRVGRIGVFQVMHHGAEPNWRKGVAAAIAPVFSVFSSDPQHRRLKHPGAAVVRDFLRYGPVQVDKTTGFTVFGSSQSP
jgi:hypothetical protein